MRDKKRILSLGLALVMTLVIHPIWKTGLVRADDQIEINATNFEDPNFRDVLSSKYDSDKDGFLNSYEITNINKKLDVSGKTIKSLKGIELFTDLDMLLCSNNQLTKLDVSKNTKLTLLYCNNNQLTDLNLHSNTELLYLECNNNKFTGLDVSDNLKLVRLTCSSNALTSLDVTNNTALVQLSCGINQITQLTLSQNTELTYLDCCYNQLTALDVSKNSKLNKLYCYNNQLASLNLSGTSELQILLANNNQLTSLTLSSNSKLKELWVNDNQLTDLDLKSNPNLEEISCSSNALTNLDTSKNTKLKQIVCTKNPITSFDFSGNPDLESLYVSDTLVTSLDLSTCSNLSHLACERTTITSLNLEKCTSLESATIYGNTNLTSLAFGNNENLQSLYCQFNALTSIDVSGLPNLSTFTVNSNQLTDIDVSQNPHLEFLRCSENQISDLDVSQNTELETLECGKNQLTSLDVSSCIKLKHFECELNQLSELDLNQNPDLENLKCYRNNLSELDIHACPVLIDLVNTVEREEYGTTAQYVENIEKCLYLDKDVLILTEIAVYTVNVTTDGNGTAAASAPSGNRGDLITLTATPNEGYRFKEWQVISGDVTITDNTFVIGKKDVEIKAIFEAISTPDPDPVTPDPDPVDPQPVTPDPQPVKEPSFEEFIDRLYLYALLREPEADGKAFWMNKVLNEGFTGGRCAYGFLVEAQEFLNRDLTNEQFIDTLYQIFFDRAPDEGGKAFWLSKFAEGMTRAQMVNGFIDSTEWCNLCASYGVKSGAPNAKAEKPSNNAIKFATRLYTECLGREYDADGLQFWALRLTNLESSGYEAALGFFTSQEFQQKGIGDDEFIHRLYRTFMGRDEDADGFAFWKSHLGVDMTREDLVKGFAQSQEFTIICNQYGIDKGI